MTRRPARERNGSSAGHYQEKLGLPAAGKILKKLGVEEEKFAAIKELIVHHHTPGKIKTNEGKQIAREYFFHPLSETGMPGRKSL